MYSQDYACLMSPNKDETGRMLSQILLLMVMWFSSLTIMVQNISKMFDDGQNKYYLPIKLRAKL